MNCNSGDLILFSEKYLISEHIIKPITNSHISHVGIILKGYKNIDGSISNKENVFCLESHVLNFNEDNIISKILKGGVFIVPLEKRIKQSTGNIYVFKLNKDIKMEEYIYKGKRVNGEQLIWEFYNDNKNKKYEYNFPLNVFKTNINLDSYFCSELVAHIYKLLGIIPEIILEHRVVPGDFLEWKKKMNKGQNIFSNDFKFKKGVLNILIKDVENIPMYSKYHKFLIALKNNNTKSLINLFNEQSIENKRNYLTLIHNIDTA